MGLFSGSRPAHLGVKDGKLSPPAARPNNVSSQAEPAKDSAHYIAPLKVEGDPTRAFVRLKDILRTMERTTIVRDEPTYIHAEFSSKTMGFVDDGEFLLDAAARVIHVRSAARLGIRDFNVNRERIEAIRAALMR